MVHGSGSPNAVCMGAVSRGDPACRTRLKLCQPVKLRQPLQPCLSQKIVVFLLLRPFEKLPQRASAFRAQICPGANEKDQTFCGACPFRLAMPGYQWTRRHACFLLLHNIITCGWNVSQHGSLHFALSLVDCNLNLPLLEHLPFGSFWQDHLGLWTKSAIAIWCKFGGQLILCRPLCRSNSHAGSESNNFDHLRLHLGWLLHWGPDELTGKCNTLMNRFGADLWMPIKVIGQASSPKWTSRIFDIVMSLQVMKNHVYRGTVMQHHPKSQQAVKW